MDKKIRAAVLRQTGEPLSVEQLTTNALSSGQILVEVIYAGICRSQVMEQQGKRGEDKWLPHLLGHEGLGQVLEIGPEVTKCKVGDRVILSWVVGSGIEAESPIYTDTEGCAVNSGKVTTFSSHSIVSENRVFLAPYGFSDKFLTLFGCALLTGGGMALKYGQNARVSKICILGFGGIGSAAALVLKGMGHENIAVIDPGQEKRVFAESLGFGSTFSSIEDSNQKYDLVIESSGTVGGIQSGFENLNNNGVLVFASHPEEGKRISLNPHDLIKGKRIFGTWGGDINPELDIATIAKFLQLCGADLNLLLGQIFTIDQVNQGLAYLDSGKPGRPLLKLNEV